MLDKRLRLGGLQVGGPRTMQNPARFRVANNVYQTLDDYLVPRADSEEYEDTYTGSTTVAHVSRYKNKPFVLGYDGTKYLPHYESSTKIAGPDLPGKYGSLGVQAVEKLGNLYFQLPGKGLFKYDGYNAYRAGTPMPFYQVVATYLITPTFFTRVIQSHMDQNGNVVNSGYYDSATRLVTGKIQLRTDKGATPDPNIIRPAIETASIANGFNAYFISSSAHSFPTATTVELTTGGDHLVVPGIRLIFTTNAFQRYLVSSLPVNALSYEVISSTATAVTLGNLRYLDDNGDWQDWDYSASNYYPGNPGELCYYFLTVWTSDVATGNYNLQRIVPAMYESAINKTYDVNIASVTTSSFSVAPALNLGPNLSDTYDVLTVKNLFPVTDEYKQLCFSTYGDIGLVAYANEIYFSDVSLGGAFEMTTGAGFIVVGEGDDGDVQTVCGTSDFILVSRQFKNYYLSGNMPTANYRVSEITQTSLGAYSNESAISVADKVIFLNLQGVWALYGGGKCEQVSENIKGLFRDFSNTTSFAEEAYFDLDAYPTYVSAVNENEWVRTRLDVNRNLLAFVTYAAGVGKCLILNLNNGEFYTWANFTHGGASPNMQDMCFIDGFYYVTNNAAAGVCQLEIEDKDSYSYVSIAPAVLATSWFTGGEPSLDKKLNQLKMWGIVPAASIRRTLDWMESTEVDCGEYANSVVSKFSHKHRLVPSNFQSVSVRMAFTQNFQIEGLEIEFQALQENMKR